MDDIKDFDVNELKISSDDKKDPGLFADDEGDAIFDFMSSLEERLHSLFRK